MADRRGEYRELPCLFVRDLPFRIRLRLERVLDPRDSLRGWHELAAKMVEFTYEDVKLFEMEYHRVNGSPTRELLKAYGTRNKTVDELVTLLLAIENVQAVEAIYERDNGEDPAPSVEVQSEPEIPHDSDRPLSELLNERQRAGFTEAGRDELQGIVAPPASERLANGYRSIQDFPAQDCPPESSLWPLKEGTQLRKDVMRAANHASKKAGVAVLDYTKLKDSASGFADRLTGKGGARLGSGGYGIVFLAGLMRFNERYQVAVKRVQQAQRDHGAILQFMNELTVLTMIQVGAVKNNIEHVLRMFVELKGFSVNGPCPCLVYEYVAGGSLLKAIAGDDRTHVLTWTDRHKVASQVSEALVYLHTGFFGARIIHGDVKSSNILLDENFSAKLCDFGAAQLLADDDTTMHLNHQVMAGTSAYKAPEAHRGRLTVKSDAYSFGIVLFELLSGKKVFDSSRQSGHEDLRSYMVEVGYSMLPQLVDACYVNVEEKWPPPLYTEMYKIATSCVEMKQCARKSVAEVTDDLQRLTKPYALRR